MNTLIGFEVVVLICLGVWFHLPIVSERLDPFVGF